MTKEILQNVGKRKRNNVDKVPQIEWKGLLWQDRKSVKKITETRLSRMLEGSKGDTAFKMLFVTPLPSTGIISQMTCTASHRNSVISVR